MSRKKTTEEFIAQAKNLWGECYDYSHVEYIGANTPVTITCPKHGAFQCRPIDHLHKHGCSKCARERISRGQITPFEDFVKRAKQVHGDKYLYDEKSYKNINSNTRIYCTIHNHWFLQRAIGHIKGNGCPICGREGSKKIHYGVAVNDLLSETRKNGEKQRVYRVWINLLRRTLSPLSQRHKNYLDCSICDEWLLFSNFKKWYEDPQNGYQDGYHLDKDILRPHNRVYSPETCCFVPKEINSIFKHSPKFVNSNFPYGVYRDHKRFCARIQWQGQTIFNKTFTTIEEAEAAYKTAKVSHLRSIAESYYKEGKITKRVYEAILNYPIDEVMKLKRTAALELIKRGE